MRKYLSIWIHHENITAPIFPNKDQQHRKYRPLPFKDHSAWPHFPFHLKLYQQPYGRLKTRLTEIIQPGRGGVWSCKLTDTTGHLFIHSQPSLYWTWPLPSTCLLTNLIYPCGQITVLTLIQLLNSDLFGRLCDSEIIAGSNKNLEVIMLYNRVWML